MNKVKTIFKLFRCKHYIKNILIFFPLIFSGRFFNINYIFNCVLGFIAFSLISSSIYIINDIKDVDKDREHPTKRNRPIASGEISISFSIILFIISLLISFLIILYMIFCKQISYIAAVYLFLYFIINIGYSYGLKNVPIVDIFILMSGFLLRVLLGGELTNTYVSAWLYLTVISGAFYFGLGKRRNELKFSDGNNSTREVLSYYNLGFLDKFMYICLSMTIIFYALWAREYEVKYIIWTVPVVIVICMQYSLDIEGNSDGDPVEVVLEDKKLLFFVMLLFLLIGMFVYFPKG